nr:lipolytic protein [uncultured bacterium]
MTGRGSAPAPAAGRGSSAAGAVAGLAAAGVAAGVAVERALVRRSKRDIHDRHAGERFGELPCDERRTVTTPDGVELYVEVVDPRARHPRGRADAPARRRPTLVFVHGYCLDMGTFHFQRKELSRRDEYRMVFYDQPGHGRSGALRAGEYDLSALGEALRAVLDAVVPDDPVVLIGHSMGGMTIMAFAERFPELVGDRVVGAVLMATSARLIEESRFGISGFASRIGTPLLPVVRNATRLTSPVIERARATTSDVAWLLTRRYAFGDKRPSPSLVSYVERLITRTSLETIVGYLRTLAAHARYPALAALRRIPTLVIVGEKDAITPVAHSEEIVRRLRDAEFVTVPGSGHMVMLEHSDEVNRALFDFLEKITV